jgi:hypothetical protein
LNIENLSGGSITKGDVKMESEFTQKRKKEMRTAGNILIVVMIVYVAAVIITFGYGGRLAELSSAEVSLISFDGIVKIVSIVCMLILVGTVFFPGILYLMLTIGTYLDLGKSYG